MSDVQIHELIAVLAAVALALGKIAGAIWAAAIIRAVANK